MDTREITLQHEQIANEAKHWVRLTAACNSKCVFCLDAEAQDGRFMDWEHITTEIRRGRDEKQATRLVVSGGEATIHPRFHDAVRFGKSVGYRWVQTVTNGQRLADRGFYQAAVEAGLDEITFSLHGHTPELHDRLTRTKNGFENLMKAMMRAVRDGKLIVNVDVCINRQNVEHLDKIVALCARVGVREFDLLHVIPQGVAWDNRDTLFYDVDAHAESLRKVFRLARHPGFHIWTNRFPVQHLEGMEELIQDPHKMLDEVGGRRMLFRKYLDEGKPIECRDTERCPHCFIEPFCSSLDRHLQDQHQKQFDVAPEGAPYRLVTAPTDAPGPWYARLETYGALPPGSIAVAWKPEHLDQLDGVEVEVELNPAMRAALAGREIPPNWRLHAPTHLHAEDAALDPDWPAFFATLPPGVRVSNLPACLCPGTTIERPLRILSPALFHEDGRMAIDPFVDHYVESEYRAKSLRCKSCPADRFCRGGHLQSLRAHGFKQLQPLTGDWADTATARLAAIEPDLGPRLRDGAAPQPGSVRFPVPGNPPVPDIDVIPGRRS